jgi:hypothetical protein
VPSLLTPLCSCAAAKDGCKSFTYSAESQDCSWSSETMGHDPVWTYFTKEKRGETPVDCSLAPECLFLSWHAAGTYDVTEGMKYENRKDRQLTDQSKEECEKACDGGVCALSHEDD